MTHPMNRDELIAAIQFRSLVDAFLEGSRAYWLRRAEQLEAARPRPGDFNGQATPAELAVRYQALTDAAQACRNRASGLDGVALADLADTAAALRGGVAA